ncbi:MAG TPA: hypothetical protein VLC92_07515 [Rhodocyclaceae bacterium]|nr:hypothetical protein [Rhodocyclaceae bacterium]
MPVAFLRGPPCGFDLAACPTVTRWQARVATQPACRGMDEG